jgi:RecB family exonuclease
VITPRRTRLVRVSDLHSFRHAIVTLCARASSAPIVVVPTAGAARQMRRTFDGAGRTQEHEADRDRPAPMLATRDELYDLLHGRLPGAPRRLGSLERDILMQAAARAAAVALGDDVVPFRLRAGLVAEMLRFYDQLRRQSQRLERFNELIEEVLGGGAGDRGTDRLLGQTRFLNETFARYEQLREATGAWDEHVLRDRLMRDPCVPAVTHAIVTLADWIADPDGLFIGDFDLLSRMPGLQHLDIVCTEQVLGSGFHERIHGWWPGLDEWEWGRDGAADAVIHPRPVLEVPREAGDHLWYTLRDREEELVAVAQHVKAGRRTADSAPPLDRVAVVFKRPLPYLYLAPGTLGAAGLPFQASDALPLAGEPFVATLDLVIDVVQSSFARDALVALLGSPHVQRSPGVDPASIHAFGGWLREQAYIGDLAALEALATRVNDDRARPALAVALSWSRQLSPLLDVAPASTQLERLAAFVESHVPGAQLEALAVRGSGPRQRLLRLLSDLAAAHAALDDPDWTVEDLAGAVHRWVEDHMCPVEVAPAGLHLIDDRAARYGSFDDMTIVGLVESEWPERQARNIFYPSGLLRALGWPSEATRRRAADARFLDLIGSADRRVAVSTVTLDDDAIVMRSMQLDEMVRLRLPTVPVSIPRARITPDEGLALDPTVVSALAPPMRAWADLRLRRTASSDPAYHGSTGAWPDRAWSVSALEVYLACPFKFFAQHVLRLEEEPEDADVMDPRRQGQFVHRVFEVFFDRWTRAGRSAVTPELLDEARGVFTAVVDDEIARLPAAEAALERTRLLGSAAAAGLGEAVLRMEAERPARVIERLLEHRLDGTLSLETDDGPRSIALRGKADRIDLLDDGTFRLIDYKLGWPPQRARALQLPIYAVAAEQQLAGRHGRSWVLGEAAYLAFKGPRRVVPLLTAHADREQVLRDAQQRTIAAVDAIARGEFPPRPEDVYLCESCSFSTVCRKDYVGDV